MESNRARTFPQSLKLILIFSLAVLMGFYLFPQGNREKSFTKGSSLEDLANLIRMKRIAAIKQARENGETNYEFIIDTSKEEGA